jgi:hypothetical protein
VAVSIERAPAGYRWPKMEDFGIMAIFAIVFAGFKRLFYTIFIPAYRSVCREQNDVQLREVRTKKGVTNIFKFLYFTFSSYFSWVLLKDSYILPPILGG